MLARIPKVIVPFSFHATLTLPIAIAVASMPTREPKMKDTPLPHDSSHDFDFLHGKWTMHNRRLVKRLADSHDWVEFAAASDCRPLPGGLGNQDVYRTDYWPDFVGLSLRIYNPQTRQWSISWVDNHNAPGVWQPAQVGVFSKAVGIFDAADSFNGKPVVVRFIWKKFDKEHARWEQAFSPDNGKTWETNWTMDLTRATD